MLPMRRTRFTQPRGALRRRDELLTHLGEAHDALTKVLAHHGEIPEYELGELRSTHRLLVELIEDNR